MALETLREMTSIGGFPVLQERPKKANGETDWATFDDLRKTHPVYVDHDVDMISFRIQQGPIKEVGVNGCQIDTMIETAMMMLYGLNLKFPCTENDMAIGALEAALRALEKRKANREARGVEGLSKA